MKGSLLNLEELGYEKFDISKPIRLIELFGGYGSQAFALKYLGVNFEHWKLCEWAVKSIQAYKDAHCKEDTTDYSKELTKEQIFEYLYQKGISANYNEPMSYEQVKRLGERKARIIYNNIQATHNLVNIQQAKGSDLEITDKDEHNYILTYSFPCGLAGTKILTKQGYKNIEDVTTDDYVITHKNRFCKVNKIMSRLSNHYYKLKGLGVPELYLTEEHPLYVLRDNKPQWVKVKDLNLNDKFAFNINQNNIDVKWTKEHLWLLGRYVADGWINKKLYNSVEFAINFNKEEQFLSNIPLDYKERFKKFKKDCWEYRIADREFQELCKEFGNGALNKHIPNWIVDLPKDKLQAFFDGYLSGDGHIRYRGNVKQIMFSTVSETLFLGLQQIVAKLYGAICTCSIRHDHRKSTYNDTYNAQLNISDKRTGQKQIEDKIYTSIKEIERFEEEVPVYNFEVNEDNSYTCQNVIVHNCQDLSLAGKGKGMSDGSDTRSSMLWQVGRILEECKELDTLPQVLIMENVPQVHGFKNIEDFKLWINKLEQLGYSNYYKDLNGKNFGIPQNRERCFMVSLLGNYKYDFPREIPLEYRLKNLLEKEVDEKYYLSDKALQGLQSTTFAQHKLENRTEKDGVAPTLCARDYKDPQLVQEEIKQVAQMYPNSGNPQAGRVYDKEGLSPCLDTCQGGNREVKIVDENCSKLQKEVCNKAVNYMQPGDTIDYTYSNSRLDEMKHGFIKTKNSEDNTIMNTLTTNSEAFGVCVEDNSLKIKNATKQGYLVAEDGDGVNISGRMEMQRGNVQKGMAQTIKTSCDIGVVVDEPRICASRGRNPENPNSREKGEHLEQRIELGPEGLSNTLTTVQKDNYLVEPRIIEVNKNAKHQQDLVQHQDGIARCLCCGTHGSSPHLTKTLVETEPQCIEHNITTIVKVRKYPVDTQALRELLRERKSQLKYNNDYIAEQLNVPKTNVEHWFRNDEHFSIPTPDIWFKLKELLQIDTDKFDESIMTFEEKESEFDMSNRAYEDNGISPTLTTQCNSNIVETQDTLKRQMCNQLIEENKVRENDVIRHSYSSSRMAGEMKDIQQNNLSPTLDTRCDCLGVCVKDEPKVIGGIGEKKSNGGSQWYQQDRIYDDKVAITISTGANPFYKSNLRIRKLTPKECFRLMAVKDKDFEKIAENQSNASLYHLAGDSIIVCCLMAIFGKLLNIDWKEHYNPKEWWNI